MANPPVAKRVRKHRDALRAQGLRPMQVWIPDTRVEGFAEECARQVARGRPQTAPTRS